MEQIQYVDGLRVYSTIWGNRLSIVLPENFDFQEVEVIIIPRQMKSVSNNKVPIDDWKNEFLSISKWDISEDEIKIKSWNLPEY